MFNIIIKNLLIDIIVFTIIINKISSDKPEVSLTRDDGEQVIREGEDLRSELQILHNHHHS